MKEKKREIPKDWVDPPDAETRFKDALKHIVNLPKEELDRRAKEKKVQKE